MDAELTALGDQGVLARLADEGAALRLAEAVRRASPPWLLDVVQAYVTVAVFHDQEQAGCAEVASLVGALLRQAHEEGERRGRLHEIPCCYRLGPDLDSVAGQKGLTPDEVIALHSGTEYTVYAVGFCPGFPYLGYLPEGLCGLARLESPRVRVEAGSVGLTGRQTGIYTEPRPGGWRIVGRTPLCLVDVPSGYFPLRTGDRVRFVPIDAEAFRRLEGRRLG